MRCCEIRGRKIVQVLAAGREVAKIEFGFRWAHLLAKLFMLLRRCRGYMSFSTRKRTKFYKRRQIKDLQLERKVGAAVTCPVFIYQLK